MGRSSLLGLDYAAIEPAGRDSGTLGPGDNSDSGSDRMGLEDVDTDDPVERHPARRGVDVRNAGVKDIGVDRIFTPGRADGAAEADGHSHDDADLAFIDSATAGDPVDEDEPEDDDGDDDDGKGLQDEGDNIPGAQATPHPIPPGKNPAPDGPENPGLPGDEEDEPPEDDPDGDDHRPGRAED